MDYIIGSGLDFEPPYNTRTCTLTSRFSFEDSSFGTAYLVWNGSTGSSCYYYCFVRGWMKNILNINISNCNYEYGKDFELYLVDLSGFQSPTSIDKIFTTSPLKLGDNDMASIIKENDWNNPEHVGYVEIALIGKILNNNINEDIVFDLTTTTKDRLSTIKNIKQRTTNNSFNTYPIGMNAEFITIPAGTANLYENNVNAEEGINILKNYADNQIMNLDGLSFIFSGNSSDSNNFITPFNVRIFNANGNDEGDSFHGVNGNLWNNIRAWSSSYSLKNISLIEIYAPNTTNYQSLFYRRALGPFNTIDIDSIDIIKLPHAINTCHFFYEQGKLLSINNLDFGYNLKNTVRMFDGCANLTTIPNFNTSNVINMAWMFNSCVNLTTIPNLDTSNVVDMNRMFSYCSHLTNISNFNTSNVTSMGYMFDGCYNLTNIPLFGTSNVTNMTNMFNSCVNLTTVPNLDTSNVVDMSYMFQLCHNLKSTINFNTSNVTNISGAFIFCENLTNINRLNLNKAIEIYYMIEGCDNLSNLSILNIANSLPYYNNIVNANKYNTLDYIGFSNKQISVIINNPYASNYVKNHGWALPKINYELAYTNISNPDVWINYNLLNQPITNNAKTLRDAFRNKDIDTANIVKLNVINLPGVTNGSYLFAYNGSNYNFSKMTNVEHLNMQALQNASHLFYNDRNLINISNFNTSNVIDMSSMFRWCTNLTTIPNFNTINVTNMQYIFGFCRNLTNIPNLNTSNVIDMNNMFTGCENLTTIPNFDTSNVTNMYRMFVSCNNLTTIPNFDTSKVTNMSEMFDCCENLTNIPNFNTSNVTSMDYMFSYCENLTMISNFNTSKVTDMSYMFYYCYNLTTVPNFNTSNVINMRSMFNSCSNLTTVPNFNTSNVINMGYMFNSCSNLTTVPNFNTSNVINMRSMFNSCSNLSSQSIDNIVYSLPLYQNIVNGNPSINQYLGLTNAQINNMSANAKQAAEDKGWMILPQIRVDYTYYNGVSGVNKIYNIENMTGEQQYQNLFNLFDSQLDITNITNIKITSSDNKISNMYSLFDSMHQVTNINMQINTPNVTNMSDLFYDCWNLINISNLNTIRVTSMTNMFTQCKNIINIPNFKTSNVTNMSNMFWGCSNLTTIPNLNTSKVINMYYMFGNCRNLTTIPNFDTSNVTDMYAMFAVCGNLTTIPIFNTSSVANMGKMFAFCSNLSQDSLQNIIISIPDRDQITGTTTITNLEYIGLSATQINNLPNYYKQIAADKNWYVEGYEAKGRELIVGTANILGDITFDESEEYPMTLTYDDMFGDYCLENTNQGKASTDSSATLTVSEDILNIFDPMWNFQVYYSSESADDIRIYKNGDLLYEYNGYNRDNEDMYLEAEFWLEVQAGDELKFTYHKDYSVDNGLDGCKIYIGGWKNNKSYEVRYSTVDAPTTYITKFILKEDN